MSQSVSFSAASHPLADSPCGSTRSTDVAARVEDLWRHRLRVSLPSRGCDTPAGTTPTCGSPCLHFGVSASLHLENGPVPLTASVLAQPQSSFSTPQSLSQEPVDHVVSSPRRPEALIGSLQSLSEEQRRAARYLRFGLASEHGCKRARSASPGAGRHMHSLLGEWCCRTKDMDQRHVVKADGKNLMCETWQRRFSSGDSWTSKTFPIRLSLDEKWILWGEKGTVHLDLETVTTTSAVWLSGRKRRWSWYR